MSLAPLAVVADVQAAMPDPTVNLTAGQTAQATAQLTRASNRIRSFTGQDFTTGSSSVITPSQNGKITLRQLPVISIDSVEMVLPDGVSTISYGLFRFDGRDTLTIAPADYVVNGPDWAELELDFGYRFYRTFKIGYTHGYATIPDDVRELAADMVARVIVGPTVPGLSSEQIGGYSYRMTDAFTPGMVGLTDDEKTWLRFRYGAKRNKTIEMRF